MPATAAAEKEQPATRFAKDQLKAIVERIARSHGGRLDLLTRAGGGLIARVSLPLAETTALPSS